MDIFLDKYTLNIEKFKKDDDKVQQFITTMYMEMLSVYRDYCSGHYTNKDSSNLMTSYFNTLYYNGYLLDIRDIKIESIINNNE